MFAHLFLISSLLLFLRCFGLLIAPGKNSKNNDMHLIDMVSMGVSGDGRSYVISGNWDPTEACFQILNLETPPGMHHLLTVLASRDSIIYNLI